METGKSRAIGIRFQPDVLNAINSYADRHTQGDLTKAVNAVLRKAFNLPASKPRPKNHLSKDKQVFF